MKGRTFWFNEIHSQEVNSALVLLKKEILSANYIDTLLSNLEKMTQSLTSTMTKLMNPQTCPPKEGNKISLPLQGVGFASFQVHQK